MRSWQYSSTKGGMENNLSLNTVSMPQPQADQHLVKVIAAAVNSVDYRLAEFQFLHRTTFPKPASPGAEFAGIIIKPAPGSALKAGQLIFGAAGTNFMHGGAMSEYALASTKATIPMPTGLSTTDAAGIATVGLTSYQSIIPHSVPGSKVFINGGSGGVGTFGIQIAKAEGRHVTVSCSTVNAELCKSLGADEVIDYKNQDVLQALKSSPKKYDLVVNNVDSTASRALYWHAHEFTTPKARFVTVAVSHQLPFIRFLLAAHFLPDFLGGAQRKHVVCFGSPEMDQLKMIADWVVEGRVRVVVDGVFGFADVKEAYTRSKTRRARGKIVVKIAEEEECVA
ncbi:Zinc-type alcohol dehydrogenase-like protein [Lachnellula suecica]|uniref:Zinc-type alcohol dehydrogenase-like protein n=1 Tax=Lachnellula suecica TaxID=602035 RepID=A0A8T9CBJ8_9HELO|nr:Zinc-type alcohol dehydrogenase-like protein [Lachnellula suecica]